jgi:O-antigen ligase
LCIAAWLLAAGVASASRAGSALLAAEAVVILARRAPRAAAVKFAAAAAVLIAVVGAGTLLGRWREPDVWRYRREINRSALAMIAARPLGGFGLGTFARAYPAYAYFDPGGVVEHAHDEWLEWAAEGGLLYALAWFVIAISLVKPAARSMWGLGVIAVFLHASVDYPFARFGVSAWTMALIGALGAEEMREVPVRAH